MTSTSPSNIYPSSLLLVVISLSVLWSLLPDFFRQTAAAAAFASGYDGSGTNDKLRKIRLTHASFSCQEL